jgi:hypothetical protein
MANALITRARSAAVRLRNRLRDTRVFSVTVRGRLLVLERQLQEDRQLHRRVAELGDVVTELLVPLQAPTRAGDTDAVETILADYRKSI